MKKYIKPDISIVSFSLKQAVMTAATPAPGAIMMNEASTSVLSEATNYIPDSVDNKVWSSYDDENWNWSE